MNLLGFSYKIYVRCMFLSEDHPPLELTFLTEATANLNWGENVKEEEKWIDKSFIDIMMTYYIGWINVALGFADLLGVYLSTYTYYFPRLNLQIFGYLYAHE